MALYTFGLTPGQFYEMTMAEFKAVQEGYKTDEEGRIKELAWNTFWTLRAVKRPPGLRALYKQLTGKAWNKLESVDDENTDKETVRQSIRDALKGTGPGTTQGARERAVELGKHISERREARRNGS